MGQQDNGANFETKRILNGPRTVVFTIVGLTLFTLFATLATYYGGRLWGNAINKKALENERQVQSERMRMKEKAASSLNSN
jgi:membrane protein DedA with SNARE-associated domain